MHQPDVEEAVIKNEKCAHRHSPGRRGSPPKEKKEAQQRITTQDSRPLSASRATADRSYRFSGNGPAGSLLPWRDGGEVFDKNRFSKASIEAKVQ